MLLLIALLGLLEEGSYAQGRNLVAGFKLLPIESHQIVDLEGAFDSLGSLEQARKLVPKAQGTSHKSLHLCPLPFFCQDDFDWFCLHPPAPLLSLDEGEQDISSLLPLPPMLGVVAQKLTFDAKSEKLD